MFALVRREEVFAASAAGVASCVTSRTLAKESVGVDEERAVARGAMAEEVEADVTGRGTLEVMHVACQ